MAIASVNDLVIVKQDATKEGSMTREKALARFARDLVIEHGRYTQDGYSLYFCTLPKHDQRIFLLHLLDPSDYQYFYENNLVDAALKEYEEEMQYHLNLACDEVFENAMEEMRMKLERDPWHGDFSQKRRVYG